MHDFSGPALLSCSKMLTYQVLGSQLWTALPLEKSRSPETGIEVSKSRHSSRTKLRVKLSHDQKRDNIELYLHRAVACDVTYDVLLPRGKKVQ